MAPLDARPPSQPRHLLRDLGSRRVSLGLERRERRQQAPAEERAAGAEARLGLLLSSPTTILLLGSDHATGKGGTGRAQDQHADSMTLLHTDPGRHRLVYLSIPRDLQTNIPGVGEQKINAAMQFGGPKLAVRTLDALLGHGLPINHIVVVDFNQFEKLIDAVGGITVNVPENILSDRFDCPYTTQQRCLQWKGWRFHKGPTHMTGHQALIFRGSAATSSTARSPTSTASATSSSSSRRR